MPEGDTLARIARVLRGALVGHVIERFASPLPALRDAELEGKTITSVDTRGKNLLIAFDDGRTLHTHLKMSGDWHLYGKGRSWKRPVHTARIILETDDRVAVCFDGGDGAPPVIRLLTADALRRDHKLRSIGPDLLDPAFDALEAARRIRASIHPSIAEALLDQRDVAGIGNEYKSELLFLARVDPRRAPASLTDAELTGILDRARKLMTLNVAKSRGGRITRFEAGPKVWVYGRGGEPCLECGAPIRRAVQGIERRSTYWCGRCQV